MTLSELVDEIKRKKKVLLLGALSGLITTIILGELGSDLTFAATPSLIDKVIGTGTSIATIAQTKVGIALIGMGMIIAYLIEKVINRGR